MLCAVCGLEFPIPTKTIRYYEQKRKARTIRYPVLNPIYNGVFPMPNFNDFNAPPSVEDPPIHITQEILKIAGYWVHDDCVVHALNGLLEYAYVVEG